VSALILADTGRDSLRCFGQYARGTQATRLILFRLFAQALIYSPSAAPRAHPFFDLRLHIMHV